MGKSTISMVIFNSFLYVYQAGYFIRFFFGSLGSLGSPWIPSSNSLPIQDPASPRFYTEAMQQEPKLEVPTIYIHKAYVRPKRIFPQNISKYGQTYGTNVPPFQDPEIPIDFTEAFRTSPAGRSFRTPAMPLRSRGMAFQDAWPYGVPSLTPHQSESTLEHGGNIINIRSVTCPFISSMFKHCTGVYQESGWITRNSNC